MTEQSIQEMVAKVAQITSKGDPCDMPRAESVIRAGVILEGRVLYRTNSGQELRYEGGEARTYTWARLTSSIPAAPDSKTFSDLLILEAINQGRMAAYVK